uniref:NADH dehydrogenase subunit 3 n=1 Tax=Spizellomyces sp. 'palustris' TaxID=117820 RepID=UPI0010FBC3A2|nr:NADH dehydrogenase subunit 3 [Spizellomyces sp. 'palustris']QCQ69038.1 NADH dehydrogenase subunit 3 [Spizellomyces sp. 'palustris']
MKVLLQDIVLIGGLEPVGDARMKFDILYYVIGILYLIFDLEIIFLFPLATVLFSLGSLLAFWVVMIFLIILTIGFLYEFFHGALDIINSI